MLVAFCDSKLNVNNNKVGFMLAVFVVN